MSVFEFIFVLFIALGIIPNTKLVNYYKKLIRFRNSTQRNTRVIGDDSVKEEWRWINDEDIHE